MQQKTNRPMIRPQENQYGCEISIEGATGIAIPGEDFKNSIAKRAVRIGIFDKTKREYVANAVQVEADWAENARDKWIFKKTNTSLNPVLFRSTKRDDLNLENMQFVFEFVIYYKQGNTSSELCCGWACTDDLSVVSRSIKVPLEVQGGSPTSKIMIQAGDVDTKRTGFQGFLKAFGGKIKNQITVNFKPHTSLEPDTKLHMQFLPSTCLVQKKMLLFVSAYRNYAGKQLLKQGNLGGQFKQPGGSVVLSCFPKIIDNIDILETVLHVWQTEHVAALSA